MSVGAASIAPTTLQLTATASAPPAAHAPAGAPRVVPRTVYPPPTAPGGAHAATGRLPSLDGLRAVSIILVTLWHVSSRGNVPVIDQLWRIDAGNLGVRTFFVISGFLITSLLLTEHRRTGSVALRSFYMRRVFRIMPAYYAFLLIVWGASLILGTPTSASALRNAALYLSDYASMPIVFGHTWSLSVEEQFYLLWPGLLLLLGPRSGLRTAAAMLLISPLLRTLSLIVPNWPDNPRYAFECVADAIAVGCLLAGSRERLWAWRPYRRLIESRGAEGWPIALLVAAAASVGWPWFGAALGISVVNVVIAFGIDRSVRLPASPLGRVLNCRPAVFIGVLSYSIYLWQQPFLLNAPSLSLPIALLAVAVCATGSYYLIESPSLRLRARLSGRARQRDTSERR
jgi:peptidoglycan/LPS O-acetylase OafA/YrhL